MEHVLHTTVSWDDINKLIDSRIAERLLDLLEKNEKTNDSMLTYAQVFEKFYLRPERLFEWKMLGLINEYSGEGQTVRFKMAELFDAFAKLSANRKKEISKEVEEL